MARLTVVVLIKLCVSLLELTTPAPRRTQNPHHSILLLTCLLLMIVVVDFCVLCHSCVVDVVSSIIELG